MITPIAAPAAAAVQRPVVRRFLLLLLHPEGVELALQLADLLLPLGPLALELLHLGPRLLQRRGRLVPEPLQLPPELLLDLLLVGLVFV